MSTLLDRYIDVAEGRDTESFLAREVADITEVQGYEAAQDGTFRVLVPWSGGMDSTTLAWMGYDAGLPVVPVYVDTGAAYSDIERYLAVDLLEAPPAVIELPTDYVKHGVIDLARNGVIMAAIAEWAARQGWWGHIWFGNGGDPGETTWRGGDKSFWFVHRMNVDLAEVGLDFTVQSPLIGLTKGDQVALWQRADMDAEYRKTLSCTSPVGGRHCRRCTSCAMRWLAWKENRTDLWPDTDMLAPLRYLVEKREKQNLMKGRLAENQRNLINRYAKERRT